MQRIRAIPWALVPDKPAQGPNTHYLFIIVVLGLGWGNLKEARFEDLGVNRII
jgi:hypothetical protein